MHQSDYCKYLTKYRNSRGLTMMARRLVGFNQSRDAPSLMGTWKSLRVKMRKLEIQNVGCTGKGGTSSVSVHLPTVPQASVFTGIYTNAPKAKFGTISELETLFMTTVSL